MASSSVQTFSALAVYKVVKPPCGGQIHFFSLAPNDIFQPVPPVNRVPVFVVLWGDQFSSLETRRRRGGEGGAMTKELVKV